MGMKIANATWAPSILRSAVDTIGEREGTILIFLSFRVLVFPMCVPWLINQSAALKWAQ